MPRDLTLKVLTLGYCIAKLTSVESLLQLNGLLVILEHPTPCVAEKWDVVKVIPSILIGYRLI